ncbi:MAG: hypothetical protein MjAS7_1112 [Metallosphaera javensis (ex Sakai et al. 2022)]|nr:MAG: hypothetical protein MjAS7_1112 [Metallosphaera javensis (ex Sakai et al. 2022)]
MVDDVFPSISYRFGSIQCYDLQLSSMNSPQPTLDSDLLKY